MSSVFDLEDEYKAICKKHAVQPTPFVLSIFEFINHYVSQGKLDTINGVHLPLGGNNFLMTNTRLSDQEAAPLVEFIKTAASCVTSLDLRYNPLTDTTAALLADLLKETNTLRELNLMCCDIGSAGGAALARSLESNVTLTSLDLTGNKIGKAGGMAFAQMLQINTTLETLNLGDCDLTVDAVIALCTVLRCNKTLRRLNINRPLLRTVQEETQVHLGKMLMENDSLLELHMEKYELRDFGTARVVDGLLQNCKLSYLNMANNRITRDGCLELCKVLGAPNYTLTFLDLGQNRLEDHGAVYLAQKLVDDNILETLVLTNNKIGSTGLNALAETIAERNTHLQQLFVWGNEFDSSSAQAFGHLSLRGRLPEMNTDVRPYEVDGVWIVSELNNRPRRHCFAGPYYGQDIPMENELFAEYTTQRAALQKALVV